MNILIDTNIFIPLELTSLSDMEPETHSINELYRKAKEVNYHVFLLDTQKKDVENDKNEDSVIAKTIFGKKPELVGIFYNLIRGTVNYEAEKIQFLNELKKSFSNNTPYIFKSYVNNFVDIARDTAYGNSSNYIKDFDSVVKEFLKRMENKK